MELPEQYLMDELDSTAEPLDADELDQALTSISESLSEEDARATAAAADLAACQPGPFTQLLLSSFGLEDPAWHQAAAPQPAPRVLIGLNPTSVNPAGGSTITTGMGAAFMARAGRACP